MCRGIFIALQRSQRPTIRITFCLLAIVTLFVSKPGFAAIIFNGFAMVEGKGDKKEGCYFATDSAYQSKLELLGTLALGASNGTLGCVTYPYMAGPYDVDGSLNMILNDVHAGIDLRTKTPSNVFSIDGGTVVYQNLCIKSTIMEQKLEPKCLTPDGTQHSTLIIENLARTHKVLYLHLSKHDDAIAKNSVVKKGANLGLSGNVGADALHLHIEVWASTAQWYCSREKSISGSACPNKPERTLANKSISTSYCELDDVRMHTVDPAEALEKLALSSPMGKTSLSVDTPLLLRSFGPVNVGATAAEAAKAIGSPLIGDVSTVDCGYARPQYGPGGVSFMMIDGRIARIEIDSCQLKTRSGAGIRDTESRVKSLYPGIKVDPHFYDDNGHYLTLVPKDAIDGNYRLLFETDGKRVTKFRAGRIPEVDLVEGCF